MFGVHLLVFEGAPQALDENVVQSPTLSVHADADANVMVVEDLDKGGAGELTALIDIQDFRGSVLFKRSVKASTQNAVSIVLESRQANT